MVKRLYKKQTIDKLREKWLENKKKEEIAIKDKYIELTTSSNPNTNRITKLDDEISKYKKEKEKNKRIYHRYFKYYINNKLNSIELENKLKAEKEIKKIKSNDDWNDVFKVLEKYGVKL